MLRAGGIATTRQLEGVFTRTTLQLAVEEGLIVRVERGRYVLPSLAEARRHAHRLGGTLALTSAALEWGWPVKTVPECPCVAVAPGRNITPARREGVDVTWRALAPADIAVGGPHTSAVRTVLDCATSLPFDEGLAVADSALRSGLVSSGDLTLGAEGHPRRGRARALRVAALASPLAENPFESVLRAAAIEAAPDVRWAPQHEVEVVTRVLRPDVACPELRIALEADSFEFHGQRSALVTDCWRYNQLIVAGWLVLRFAWEQVMFEWEWVGRMIAGAVAQRLAASRVALSCSTRPGPSRTGTQATARHLSSTCQPGRATPGALPRGQGISSSFPVVRRPSRSS